MNKGELIDAISTEAGCTKKQAETILNATIKTIQDAVVSGEKVTIVDFGMFEPRFRKARDGRNPKTNEKMRIPAKVVPAFSAGKLFKKLVGERHES